jgi:hypothetical protein
MPKHRMHPKANLKTMQHKTWLHCTLTNETTNADGPMQDSVTKHVVTEQTQCTLTKTTGNQCTMPQ